MKEKLRVGLAGIVSGTIRWDCPLAPYTSFGIGGPADALIEVEDAGELARLLGYCAGHDLPWHFIGKGSNLLVADSGFAGVVLLLGKGFSEISVLPEPGIDGVRLRVGAGCSFAKLLNWCTERDYSGFEFAAGIPGTLGGAVVMNAGAWGEEIADKIEAIEVFSLHAGVETLCRDQLDFSYRLWHNQGIGDQKRIVLSVDLRVVQGEKEKIQNRCREILRRRKESQPKGQKSGGSFFKNPTGDSAGRLIEASGLKGRSCGGAMVSPVHANFLVNTGSATAEDMAHLMNMVIEQVKKDSGIQLLPEVHFL